MVFKTMCPYPDHMSPVSICELLVGRIESRQIPATWDFSLQEQRSEQCWGMSRIEEPKISFQPALGSTEELDGGLPLHGFLGSSGVYALLHSHALPVNIRAHRPAEHVA